VTIPSPISTERANAVRPRRSTRRVAKPAQLVGTRTGAGLDEAALVAIARAEADRVLDQVEARYRANPAIAYDGERAERFVSWFPTFLRHSKGKLAGQPFDLEGWQARAVRIVFGYRWRETGRRVVRTLYLRIPRKNGKSTFAAGLALLLLFIEQGAEVYSLAADTEQASIVFKEATAMVAQSPPLQEKLEAYKTSIVFAGGNAVYKPTSSTPNRKHGFNPSAFVLDEVHAQPTRDLYDVFVTAMGAREEPFEALLTTAGDDDPTTLYAELDTYAQSVRDGAVDDISFLPILFGADKDDDWENPEVWARANPSLGRAIRLDFLAEQAKKARDLPTFLPVFRRLHLNINTSPLTRAIQLPAWDACTGPVAWKQMLEQLRGTTVWVGVDLASTTDLASIAVLAPPAEAGGIWRVAWKVYIPESGIVARARRDRVPYAAWRDQGAITTTEGDVIDLLQIEADVLALRSNLQILGVGYDPWQALAFAQRLQGEKVPVFEVRQGLHTLAAPTRDFLTAVAGRTIAHGGHPVGRWQAANLVCRSDENGNSKPDKEKSVDKIDMLGALMNAWALALTADPPKGPTVYRQRGLLVL
jgi:phage terminase large subunit-like protein